MLAKIVLWLLGIGFLGFGAWALGAPRNFSEFVQFSLNSSLAVTEMRAFYGGLELGLGAFFILGALRPDLTKAALMAGAITMTTMAASRLFGLVVDGSTGTILFSVLGVEVVSAAACIWALRASK